MQISILNTATTEQMGYGSISFFVCFLLNELNSCLKSKTCEPLTGFLSFSKLFLNHWYTQKLFLYSLEKIPKFKETAQTLLLLIIKKFRYFIQNLL